MPAENVRARLLLRAALARHRRQFKLLLAAGTIDTARKSPSIDQALGGSRASQQK
jgi:hypothetical protein